MEQKYVMAAIDAALKAGEKILSIYNDPASDFEIQLSVNYSRQKSA
jgi:3'(2'), 5'-bisphosphate nucleotidase